MAAERKKRVISTEEAAIRERLADREWRIDNLYYIKDKLGNTVKFVRNESQRQFWHQMWFLNLILKDRQRGFSTLIAIFILDYCLFNSGTEAGIVDITLPDAKKKLGKIKFAYDNLPAWFRETVTLTTEAKETLAWSNGSSVSVGTSHRGGTLQILHISEMGKIAAKFPERAREIRTGAMNTVAPGRFIFNESTAEGNAGEYYEDCQTSRELLESGAELTPLDYKFHFFAWWHGTENEMEPGGVHITDELAKYFVDLEAQIGQKLSPRKKAWYAKKSAQQKDDMKREFPGTPDEAFETAIEGTYLSTIMTALKNNGQIGVVPIDRAFPVNSGWDFGLNDTMTIWLHQRISLQDRLVGYISGTDQDVLWYWQEMQNRYSCLWGTHYLPHDASARRIGTATNPEMKPKTLEQILNDAGMKNTQVIPVIGNKWTAIQEVKLWLPSVFIDKANCGTTKVNPRTGEKDDSTNGIKCLQNFRREWDEKNGCWKNTPRHDWAMHGYDGLETLVRGLGAYDSASSVKPATPKWKEKLRRSTRRRTGQAA